MGFAVQKAKSKKAHNHDRFEQHSWNDYRLFLINSGGSHHFSTARYLAKKLGTKLPLKPSLKIWKIDEETKQLLLQTYAVFVMPSEFVYRTFRKGMRRLYAPYGYLQIPGFFALEAVAVFLPRDSWRSRKVANCLADAEVLQIEQLM